MENIAVRVEDPPPHLVSGELYRLNVTPTRNGIICEESFGIYSYEQDGFLVGDYFVHRIDTWFIGSRTLRRV
jgi:hypothetical protein